MKCLQSVMHHKDLQFKHELKKKEREVNKLKDRLHQMFVDKNPDRKVGECQLNSSLVQMSVFRFFMYLPYQ